MGEQNGEEILAKEKRRGHLPRGPRLEFGTSRTGGDQGEESFSLVTIILPELATSSSFYFLIISAADNAVTTL